MKIWPDFCSKKLTKRFTETIVEKKFIFQPTIEKNNKNKYNILHAIKKMVMKIIIILLCTMRKNPKKKYEDE